ncbi:membrane protein [soil metagenome]
MQADLGLASWDVLHQGVADTMDVSIGLVVIATSVLVLVLWAPLRQRPGVGTLANVVLVGLSLDVSIAVLPAPTDLAWRVAFLVAGIVGNGIATGLYIGAGLGPGPRDGLMTGLAARGLSLRVARTGIEAAVLLLGWGLGGTVGIGTIAYAVAIGPLSHTFIPLFAKPTPKGDLNEIARHRRQHPSRSRRSDHR